MKKTSWIIACLFAIATAAYSNPPKGLLNKKTKALTNLATIKVGLPPATWKEHWFEHEQTVSLQYYDNNVAVYYDNQVDKSVTWPFKTMSQVWAYVKKTYGSFGDSTRLYVILHQGRYGGGHPASYFNSSHDYRNMIDCGLGDWRDSTGERIGMMVHEVGHIVSGASHGVDGAPSDAIWGDSKFMEIFVYDVLLHIGRQNEAEKVYKQMEAQDPNADYPGIRYPGTRWFINWFYPIYSKYGGASVLNKYFEVIAKNYPKKGLEFSRDRDMNLGEFVHFWSGATGRDLTGQAKTAFGKYWNAEAQAEFKQAQTDFPQVKYKR
ncbi:hypothetical protein MUY27_07630 [Mucilaginibacter sp. RS28]|uniref:Uncharacterized protein n=1 Tax=Mucilaginibacter straminoryzae TaxID=2932774 RepID=A0A9X1X3R1_9SPHI|nr:hypothetical protein [Mucilaginibacter straminoryzae]MCJ8209575.1 hypothetical protein [Mucilaginibacter straminoryzae]